MPADTTISDSSSASGSPLSGGLIETRELRKSYGTDAAEIRVLDGINASVAAGEMIAIVGPSGAGKSTLLHLLAALDTPTSGTVYFRSESDWKRIGTKRCGVSESANRLRLAAASSCCRILRRPKMWPCRC